MAKKRPKHLYSKTAWNSEDPTPIPEGDPRWKLVQRNLLKEKWKSETGELEVIGYAGKSDPYSQNRWICRCKCGSVKAYFHGNLVSGKSMRCNKCSRVQAAKTNTKHGQSYNSIYRRWVNYRERDCLSSRWADFNVFFKAVGEPPENCFVVRVDKKKKLGPNNWKWVPGKLNPEIWCKILELEPTKENFDFLNSCTKTRRYLIMYKKLGICSQCAKKKSERGYFCGECYEKNLERKRIRKHHSHEYKRPGASPKPLCDE